MMKKSIKYMAMIGLVAVVFVSGCVSSDTHAESGSANASVTVANTISLTLTGGDLVINNLTPGNSADSNIITASVTSNSPFGINLSATTGTSGGTTSLVNTADSNFTFANLDSNKATLANFSDNTWGYSYSTDNGSTWVSGDYGSATTGYNGLPLDANDGGESGTTLYHIDNYAGSSSVKFKIGAKSATTQAAGTYTNTVNFYAVTNPEPILPTQSSCPSSPMINTVVPGIDYMQDIDNNNRAAVLGSLTTDSTYQIKDSRDNETYCVSMLKDGNLWMLDNLALDLVAKIDVLDENNTDASNTALSYLKNGGGSTTVGDPTYKYAKGGVVNWTSSYSTTVPLVNISYKDVVPTDAISTAGQYKIGGYYNFCAVSAGTYCYGWMQSGGDATSSICPKGWRMPTGDVYGDYQDIYDRASYNTYANYRSALHLPLSGYFDDGSTVSNNTAGWWWSSTLANERGMYGLFIATANISATDDEGAREFGLSLRCILGS